MATVSHPAFPQKETVECPDCRSSIVLYDPRGTEFCACSACYAYLQFVDEVPKKTGTFKQVKVKPVIPMGREGVLQGTVFKVIAFLEKHEDNPDYAWREYIIFNYEKGYASLSEYDGHWNVIYGTNFLPKLEKVLYGSNYVMYDDVEYKLFHKYAPKISSLTGEFCWDAMRERIHISEFIAPPFIISREKPREKNPVIAHYRGEYLEPAVIAAAFGLDLAAFPPKTGILSNQPSKAHAAFSWALITFLVLALAIFIIEFGISAAKPETVLMNEQFYVTYDPQKGGNEFKPFMTPSFEVKDRSVFLDVELTSPVNNNWMEATVILVNEKTNQTWEVTQGVEFYEGFEEGEHWTEGERTTSSYISEVPGGKYHLNVYTASGNPLNNSLSLRITANEVMWRNILAALLALAVIPALAYLAMRNFEKRRWANSDYSPFDN